MRKRFSCFIQFIILAALVLPFRAQAGISVTAGQDGKSVSHILTFAPPTAGGQVSPDRSVCEGETSGVLTLSGHSGSVIRWEYAVAPFSVWDIILHTATTYESGPLTETTRFRAVVQDGGNPEEVSLPATITVNDLPAVSLGTLQTQCVTTTSYILTGGTPPGGTYSGPAVSSGVFNPSVAGVGTHIITYSYEDANDCVGSDDSPVTVVAIPVIFTVTGSGSYCPYESGRTVSLTGSQTGVHYRLYRNGVLQGTYTEGTGLPISWSNQTAGTYTVTATAAGSNCTANMNGSAVITVAALPTAFDLIGSGTYCYNLNGRVISLVESEENVSYQLMKDGLPDGLLRLGDGDTIPWPDRPFGEYIVIATNLTTGCYDTMNGTVTITRDPQLLTSVIPDPAYVTVENPLQLEGLVYGGTGNYISIQWTGTGANFLNNTMIQTPVFTCDVIGNYATTFIVHDDHECPAYTNFVVHVTGYILEPTMEDVIRCQDGSMVMTAVPGPDANAVQFTTDTTITPYTDYFFPYQTNTPIVQVGNTITMYARAYNTGNGLVSPWISATATAVAYADGGVLTGSGAICRGYPIPLLQVSGVVGEILKWQKRVNGGNWIDISHTGTIYSETPQVAGTWEYRVVAQIPDCDPGYSNLAVVDVYAPSLGGFLSGGSNQICLNTSTGTMTLTGYLGTILNWRKRLNSLAWQEIVNTTDTHEEVLTTAGLWEFQAVVRNGVCSTVYSQTFIVQVDLLSVGGTVSGGTSLCPGVTTPTLVLTGQTGTVQKWQKRLNEGSWQDIAHTSATYYEIPASSGNWDYRAQVRYGVCNPVYSGSTRVTVYPASVGGQVNGGGTICLYTSTGTLTLTGYNNNILRWQRRLNNGGWQNIGNTNPTYSEAPTSVGIWDYRAVVGIGNCGEVFSGYATVEVIPNALGGTITGSKTVCTGQTSGLLTLSAYSGTIVKWQYAVSPFTTWSDIPNQTASYTSGPLTVTTKFRAVLESGICPWVYSSEAVITVVALPVVNFYGSLAGQCVNNTVYALSGGSPAGGTYSGPGVSGNNFNASLAGVGVWTITYTYSDTYGCSASATNTIEVFTSPTVTFTGLLASQCLSSTTYMLTGGSPSGGTYSGPGVTGTNFNASLAGQGSHILTYTFNSGVGCSGSATNTIQVYPNPLVYTLSGTAGYCPGSSGLTLSLNGSQIGVFYQLKKNGVSDGSPLNGTGSPLYWYNKLAGTYTVTALNATTACSAQMSGSVLLYQFPAPTTYNLTGGGSYCSGGSGLTVTLSGSQAGVSYQLYRNSVPNDIPKSGTGASLTWTGKTAGSYTVVATTLATGCSSPMSGVVLITEDPALTASIIPDPAYVIIGNNLNLNGGPSGGTGSYITHQWTGPGTPYLSATSIVNPVFNSAAYGNYNLTYTVTDSHGCTASDQITVHTTSPLAEPVMPNQIRCGEGTLTMTATPGVGGDQVQFSLNGSIVVYTATSVPYQYVTPVIPPGGSLTVYARTRNSGSGNTSNWVTATAAAYATSVGGFLSAGGSICLGSAIPVLSLTSYVGDVNGWWKRLNGGTWTAIPYYGTIYAETPSQAGTWEYRAEVQIPGCAPGYSTIASVVVSSPSVGGALAASQGNICFGASTGTIQLSGQTGNVVSWRKKWNSTVWQVINHTGTSYSEVPGQAGSWEYQAEVRNGNCSPQYSSIVTIQVDPESEGGSISGSGSICPGFYTPVMVASAYTGNINKWQKRFNAGAWTDIPNTLASYSEILDQQGNWEYRVEVQQGVCPPAYSSHATITVVPESVGGTVAGGGTICLGSSTPSLALMNYLGDILKWQKRLNGGLWIDIVNTTAYYNEVPSSTGTWEYRAVVALGLCQESYSDPATVLVVPATLGGQVMSDAVVCIGQNSGQLQLANHLGMVVKWQYSVAPYTSWTDIIHTQTVYTSGPLSQTTKFRVMVKNGNCPEQYSLPATIMVMPLPATTFDNDLPLLCISSPVLTLSGGSPSGGVYSGPGVISNTFNPLLAGIGTHTLTYTYTDIFGCSNSDQNTIDVEGLPTVGFDLNVSSVCVNATPFVLAGGTPEGGTYSGPGISGGVFNPSLVAVGDHVISYTYTNELGCSNTAQDIIQVLQVPLRYALSGGGNYCEGGNGLTVTLSGSESTATYQLLRNGNPLGSPLNGTGSSLVWNNQTVGIYSVIATGIQSGCSISMLGNVNIETSPLPAAFLTAGSGTYCYEGIGREVTLSGSETGVSYQLRKDNLNEGLPLTGTGNALSWPDMPEGSYTVEATIIATGCIRLMTGTAAVIKDPQLLLSILPDPAYVITNSNILMQGNASGGAGYFPAYSWSGEGAAWLSSLTMPTSLFNAPDTGEYELLLTVTDGHGCMTTATGSVHVIQEITPPEVSDQIRCGTGSVTITAVPGQGGDQIQFSLDGATIVYTATTDPFQYITPEIPVSTGLIVYARTLSSVTGLFSGWSTAFANAYEQPVGGYVTGGDEICAGTQSPLMTLNGWIGVINTWQKRYNSGNWTNVPFNGTEYSELMPFPGTWDFRVEIALEGCSPGYSEFTSVIVDPQTYGGTLVSASQEVCLGQPLSPITLTGYVGSVLYWRKRLEGFEWQHINNSNTTFSDIPYATGLWDYQAVVRSGECETEYSTIMSIQVITPSEPGNVTGGGSICQGNVTPEMSLSNYSGQIQRWEKKLNTGTWTSIPHQGVTYSETPAQAGTWYYRAVVKNGVCDEAFSTAATVVVTPLAVGGQLSAGGGACLGSPSGFMILSGYTGTIQKWQRKFENGNWVDVQHYLHYYAPVLNQAGTWKFRVVLVSGACGTAYSTESQLIVSAPTIPGNVSGGNGICMGSSTATLTLSGHLGSVVKWQKRTQGGNWTDINNINTTYSEIIYIPGIYHFRAAVRNGNCNLEYSGYTEVEVSATSIGGQVINGSSFCLGGTTNTLTLVSNTGAVQYWQKRVNGGSWTMIENTTSAYTETPPVAGTWEYRAAVKNGYCALVFSQPAVVTVYPSPAVYQLSGPSFFCEGDAGALLTLSGSESGVQYQLIRNGQNFGNPVNGTGQPMQWLASQSGAYYVTAVYTTSGCVADMAGFIGVDVAPLPDQYDITGNGVDCGGEGGGTVSLNGSQSGIEYRLYRNGEQQEPILTGTGGSLSWYDLLSGDYNVQAFDPVTLCNIPMYGSVAVPYSDLPVAYDVGGGGQHCAGDPAAVVTLSGSESGKTYTLLLNGTIAYGSPLAGSGLPLVFSGITQSGTYFIRAVDDFTECSSMMNLSASLTLLESPYVDAGPDLDVFFGSSVMIQAVVIGGSPPYTFQWTPGLGLSDSTILNPMANPEDTTCYTLIVTDVNTCQGRDSLSVNPYLSAGQSIANGILRYDNLFGTPLHNSTVYLVDSANNIVAQAEVTADGTFAFDAFPNGSYFLTGSSALEPGGINATDALQVLKHFVHLITLTGLKLKAGDVNASNFINSVDALQIQYYFTGVINFFQAGEWVFERKPYTFTGDSYYLDLLGLCVGDVNGSYIPPARLSPLMPYDISGIVPMSPGRQAEIPLCIQLDGDAAAVSLDFEIDPACFTPLSLSISGDEKAWIWTVEGQRIRLSYASLEPLASKDERICVMMMGQFPSNPKEGNWLTYARGESADLDVNLLNMNLIVPELKYTREKDGLGVLVHPNPVSDRMSVNTDLPFEGKLNLQLVDAHGSICLSKEFPGQPAGKNENILETTSLAPGLYLLKVSLEGSTSVISVSTKILVQQ
ncbi:MAG TPA: hypothetical protein P5531_02855 [Bacteroidales bacterium]|nr:hypothetical protein [Bacteroidales bacterium]HSA42541.1 hypothetical protein [Bacteroidales bacterium]